MVDNCEVIIYMLDARDPEGSINSEVMELIEAKGSKVLYVINKTDLVPEENVKEWIAKFKQDKKMLLPFQANLTIFKGSEKEKLEEV